VGPNSSRILAVVLSAARKKNKNIIYETITVVVKLGKVYLRINGVCCFDNQIFNVRRAIISAVIGRIIFSGHRPGHYKLRVKIAPGIVKIIIICRTCCSVYIVTVLIQQVKECLLGRGCGKFGVLEFHQDNQECTRPGREWLRILNEFIICFGSD